MEAELRGKVLGELRQFLQSQVNQECLNQARQNLCRIRRQELQTLLKDLNSLGAMRAGGYLDGLEEGLNFIETYFEHLKKEENRDVEGS